MSKQLGIVGVIFCLLTLSACLPSSRVKRTSIRLCGDHLFQALALVCNGNFYGPGQSNSMSRRETSEENLDALTSGQGSYSQLTRRQMQGVADECCRNSCTLLDLASYCSK